MGKDRSSKKSRPAVKLMFVALIAMTAFQSKSAFSQVKCYKRGYPGGKSYRRTFKGHHPPKCRTRLQFDLS